MKNFAMNAAAGFAQQIGLGTYPQMTDTPCKRFQELTLRITPNFAMAIHTAAGFALKDMIDIDPQNCDRDDLTYQITLRPVTDHGEEIDAEESCCQDACVDADPEDLYTAMHIARREALSFEESYPEMTSTCSGPLTSAMYERMTSLRAKYLDAEMSATIAPTSDDARDGQWFLYWTDYVTGGWHEFLPNQRLADMRLAELITVCQQGTMLSDLDDFIARNEAPVEYARKRMAVMLEGQCYPTGNGGTATSETQLVIAWQCVAELLAETVLNPVGDAAEILAHQILVAMHG